MNKHEWSVMDTVHSVIDWGKMLVAEAVAAVDTHHADAINPEDER